ncbi:hypothetical protein GCM10011348_21000 [Marinobacterium nitratireducens]|uniref:F-type H+-transporting ATPase subunit gamma n=1 Tax=Marinobacterium nitratireducens TaxID=518897 RepID=A0A918DRX2_9GAMM|nr:FoF1 ATP synthase subunit gamma [Marinobacterium nitratireducens]GGO81612.1 hypothetical protein GCM10011348_21000 [Marinobacterium nitratireducens]
MSRQQLEHHLRKLSEAREIMNAMKSLAFMETRRLSQRIEVQRTMLEGIESAASEFLAAYSGFRPPQSDDPPVTLLYGSERGFCGAFNERLLQALPADINAPASLIATGRKLCSRLEGDPRLCHALDGASVLDEVGDTLNRLSDLVGELASGNSRFNLWVLYHDPDAQEVVRRPLLPPFQSLPQTGPRHPEPDLNLPPSQCYAGLVEHYLFAELHAIAYLSLMAENQQRMQHLDGAVRYLDDRLEALAQKGREIRQEEITEEIEVILLNADNNDDSSMSR